jgi:hypothetical protein
MHDGRFSTLEQVIDFFDSGVQPNPDLDARLKAADGTPKRLALRSRSEVRAGCVPQDADRFDFSNGHPLLRPIRGCLVSAGTESNARSNSWTATSRAADQRGDHDSRQRLSSSVGHSGPGATIAYTNADNRRHSAFFFSTSAIVSTPIFTSGTQTVKMPTCAGNVSIPMRGARRRDERLDHRKVTAVLIAATRRARR